MKLKNLRFRYRIMLVFSVFVIVISMLIIIAMNLYYTKAYLTHAKQYMKELSMMTEKNFEIYIDKIDHMTQEILSDQVVQKMLIHLNSEYVTDYTENIAKGRIKDVLSEQILFERGINFALVSDLSGKEIKSSNGVWPINAQLFSEEELRQANGALLWGVLPDSGGKIVASRVILSLETMKPIGFVSIVCDEAYFSNLISNLNGRYVSHIYVLNQEEQLICANCSWELELGESASHVEEEMIAVNGEEYYLFNGNIMKNGWHIRSMIARSLIKAEMWQIMRPMSCLAVVCVLIGLCCIAIVISHMTKPLTELNESMMAIEAADFSKRIHVVRNDEFGQLGQQFNNMSDSIEKMLDQIYELGVTQKQVEVELLKMQINPHFLYNTLDTINWMARSGRDDDIIEVSTALAALLRSTIKQGNYVSVQEEISGVKHYLQIQKYRFGDKMNIVYDVSEDILDYVIPNFIMQPFVENAIIHGLEPKMEPGNIRIGAMKKADYLMFEIFDDGVGMDESALEMIRNLADSENHENHIGIRNVMIRLRNLYNGACKFSIESEMGSGTVIRIMIPMALLDVME